MTHRPFAPVLTGLLVLLLAAVAHAQDARGVTLNPATLKTGLVRTTVLPLKTVHPGIPAYGRVIDPTPLITLRSRIARALASLTLAKATLTRSRTLYHAAGNVSEASLQQAEAQATIAQSQLAALQAEARASFGPALGAAIMEPRSSLGVIAGTGSLVSVVQDGTILPAPPPAQARAPDGSRITLNPIGFAGRIPRGLAGQAFFYSAPVLAIGSPLTVTLDAEGTFRGYAVPSTAVLWHQGRAFVFVRDKADRFVLTMIPTTSPERNAGVISGYFVPRAALPGKPAVATSGAALLNSALASGATAPHDD